MARTKAISSVAGDTHNTQSAQDKYIKQLEEKIAFYEAKEIDADEGVETPISPTEYIKVMSLLPYRLNLCTKERGQGKIYKFDRLYQVKKIIYSDIIDIMEVARDFLERGFFIILNQKVVRSHGLDEIYEKILTKEKIESILSGTDEGISLYTSATNEQKTIISDLIVQRLVENPQSVDLNLVDKISRLSDTNLSKKAEDARELLNPSK